MWSIVTQVTTGITLIAFVVAIGAWVYRSSLRQKARLINLAPETERAQLVERALEFFHVDTAGLTREQKYQLALQQIGARERRFLTAAKVISFVSVLLVGISAYAISSTTKPGPSETDVRTRLEEEIKFRLEPVKSLMQGDSVNPLVQAELSFVVFTSTPPSQHNFMASRRRNVYAEYQDRNLESLFIELANMVKPDERPMVERGRDAVRRFDNLLHYGPKREIQLASHVVDDITVLTPEQIATVRDTLIPALGKWL